MSFRVFKPLDLGREPEDPSPPPATKPEHAIGALSATQTVARYLADARETIARSRPVPDVTGAQQQAAQGIIPEGFHYQPPVITATAPTDLTAMQWEASQTPPEDPEATALRALDNAGLYSEQDVLDAVKARLIGGVAAEMQGAFGRYGDAAAQLASGFERKRKLRELGLPVPAGELGPGARPEDFAAPGTPEYERLLQEVAKYGRVLTSNERAYLGEEFVRNPISQELVPYQRPELTLDYLRYLDTELGKGLASPLTGYGGGGQYYGDALLGGEAWWQRFGRGFAEEGLRPTSLAAMAIPPVRGETLLGTLAKNAALQGGANVAQDLALGRTDPESLLLSGGMGAAFGGLTAPGVAGGTVDEALRAIEAAKARIGALAEHPRVLAAGRALAGEEGFIRPFGPEGDLMPPEGLPAINEGLLRAEGPELRAPEAGAELPAAPEPLEAAAAGAIEPPGPIARPTLPDTRYDTPEVLAARAENARRPRTSDIATPERAQRREQWIDQLDRQGGQADGGAAPTYDIAQDRQAWVVLGPPAAGKSSRFVNPLLQEHRARLIDADQAKELIPEFERGKYADAVHQESSDIADALMERAVDRGDNLVWPAIGKNTDRILSQVRTLEDKGYKVHVVLNELPEEQAVARAMSRWQEGGRFVDPAYIVKIGNKPRATYDRLVAEGGVASHARYSNDVPLGAKPTLLDAGGGDRGVGAPLGGEPAQPGGRPVRLGGEGGGAGRGEVPPPGSEEPGLGPTDQTVGLNEADVTQTPQEPNAPAPTSQAKAEAPGRYAEILTEDGELVRVPLTKDQIEHLPIEQSRTRFPRPGEISDVGPGGQPVVQGVGEGPGVAPPGAGGKDIAGQAMDVLKRKRVRVMGREIAQGYDDYARVPRPDSKGAGGENLINRTLDRDAEVQFQRFQERVDALKAPPPLAKAVTRAYEDAQRFMTTAHRYTDSAPVIRMYGQVKALVEGTVPDGVVHEVARSHLVLENALRQHADEWLAANLKGVRKAIDANKGARFVGPEKFRALAQEFPEHALIIHPEWFSGVSPELTKQLANLAEFQNGLYKVVQAIDPNAAPMLDYPYLRTVWEVPESELEAAVNRPFGRASVTKRRAFPDPFEAMTKEDWPYKLKQQPFEELVSSSAHLAGRQIGTQFEKNLIVRRFGKTHAAEGLVRFKNANYAGWWAPPKVVNFIDQLHDPTPAMIESFGRGLMAPIKSFVFGIGDVAVFGQHLLQLTSTRGLASAAGAINRALEAAHLPHMALYLDDELPVAMQRELDGLPQGVMGAFRQEGEGTFLKYLPGIRVADPALTKGADILQELQYQGVLTPVRNMAYDGNLMLYRVLHKLTGSEAFDIAKPAVRRKAAENALAFSGGSLGAMRQARRGTEQAFLGAPQITRSMAASLAQLAKLNDPLAYATLANIGLIVYGAGSAINMTIGSGEPVEWDPRKPDFATVHIGGHWERVGNERRYVGGHVAPIIPQKSLVRAIGKSVAAIEQGDPAKALDAWSQFAFTRATPGLQLPAALGGVGFTKEGYFSKDLPWRQRVASALPVPVIAQNLQEGSVPLPTDIGSGGEFASQVAGINEYPGDTSKEALTAVKKDQRSKARDVLEEANYYDARTMAADKIAKEKGFDSGEAMLAELKRMAEERHMRVEDTALYKRISALAEQARENLRRRRPDVDAAAVIAEGATPLTREAADLVKEQTGLEVGVR